VRAFAAEWSHVTLHHRCASPTADTANTRKVAAWRDTPICVCPGRGRSWRVAAELSPKAGAVVSARAAGSATPPSGALTSLRRLSGPAGRDSGHDHGPPGKGRARFAAVAEDLTTLGARDHWTLTMARCHLRAGAR